MTTLYATFFTVSSERPVLNNTATITLADRGPAKPQAIMSWFYPGRAEGHEFLYPKQLQKELAKDKQVTIVSGY